MISWKIALMAAVLTGPAMAQSLLIENSMNLARYAAPIITNANRCMGDPERAQRLIRALPNHSRNEPEAIAVEVTLRAQMRLHSEMPELSTCPEWIKRFTLLERLIDGLH